MSSVGCDDTVDVAEQLFLQEFLNKDMIKFIIEPATRGIGVFGWPDGGQVVCFYSRLEHLIMIVRNRI